MHIQMNQYIYSYTESKDAFHPPVGHPVSF